MKDRQEHVQSTTEEKGSAAPSPLELMRRIARGKTKPKGPGEMPVDAQLAAFKDRVTYTFIAENEVASIHFDQRRKEIFFRGHNVRNMKLTAAQLTVLQGLTQLLRDRAPDFAADYDATLTRLLADKK